MAAPIPYATRCFTEPSGQRCRVHPRHTHCARDLGLNLGHCRLYLPDRLTERARRQQASSERPRGILAERGEARERCKHPLIHVRDLPRHFGAAGPRVIRGCQPSGLHRIRRGPQRMSTHVRHTRRLASGARCGDCCDTCRAFRSTPRLEPPANLPSRVEITTTERAGTLDAVAGAAVSGHLRFKQGQHALGAVRRPQRNHTSVGLGQCLRRNHAFSFARRRAPSTILPVRTQPCLARPCPALPDPAPPGPDRFYPFPHRFARPSSPRSRTALPGPVLPDPAPPNSPRHTANDVLAAAASGSGNAPPCARGPPFSAPTPPR